MLRFDWILDAPLEAKAQDFERVVLTKRRESPRSIFVKAEHLGLFIDRLLPDLEYPVTLYVGNSDLPLSAYAAEAQMAKWHPMVGAFCCENRDLDIAGIDALPVGIHPADLMADDGACLLAELAKGLRLSAKENVVLLPSDATLKRFGVEIPGEEHIQCGPDVLSRRSSATRAVDFWRELRGCRFLLAPRGIPHDTPAPLEALILGTIPLIEAGPLAEAYRGLPVVQIEHTSEITSGNLDRWWRELRPALCNSEGGSSDFWWRRVRATLPRRKRAFLVLGPESHGNHLLTDLLIHAGCLGNSGDHVPWNQDWQPGMRDEQPWDRALPTDEDPIVWRRSVPHLQQWPDITAMIETLERRGYEVHALVVHRERYAAVQSQLKWHHVPDAETAHENIERAYLHIFNHLNRARVPFTLVGYEMLVRYPQGRAQFLRQLELAPPASPFEVWNGNEKWYSESREDAPTREPGRVASIQPVSALGDFPETWFPCRIEDWSAYEARISAGRTRMRRLRAVFCGLARDVAKELPYTRARIERAGAMFDDYRVVLFENDSRDDTLARLQAWSKDNPRVSVLTEHYGAPRWGQTRAPERMRHLARYRNRYLEFVREQLADFDVMIVFDTDLRKGFSYHGLAHTFGCDDWHAVGSNGLLVPPEGKPDLQPMFFDAWAFRRKGELQPADAAEVNRLRFRRGEPLLEVDSCFGGMAVYSMAAIRSGACYGGDDCEHVVFHRALRDRGFGGQFLNPSQIVLYAGASPDAA